MISKQCFAPEYELGAPAWLVKASAELLCITLQSNSPKKRGRAAGLVTRYCQDMKDFARWDEVCVIREQQKNYRKQVKELRALPKAKGELLDKQKKLISEQEEVVCTENSNPNVVVMKSAKDRV
jgi:hypothetical protein